MSAYMVDDTSYSNLLATLSRAAWAKSWGYMNTDLTILEFVERLREQNNKSVNYRYREDLKLAPFVPANGQILSDAELYKLLNCIGYQACETPDWFNSLLEVLILRIQCVIAEDYVSKSRDYIAAQWG